MKLRIVSLIIPLLMSMGAPSAQPAPPRSRDAVHLEIMQAKETAKRILFESILPFWYPGVIDREEGGYRLNHDLQGNWKGRSAKRLVTQARTVWFFSRLVNAGYGTDEHLEAARHGYEFLWSRMWDQEYGGFYWEVDSSGVTATMPDKHLYGQSFGLYALSEYAMASGDPSAAALARELFGLLEHFAHDREHGGYQESFERNWASMPVTATTYMNVPPDVKLMNTHLHLMEAITTYYLATEDPVALERLVELILIQSNSVVRKDLGACTDKYQKNWIPLHGPRYDRVSYGHDIENIWLLMEACNAIRIPNGPLLDLYRTLFDYTLRYGYDREQGGFYDTGPFRAPADRRGKIWWVQAEGLVSALAMYQLTGEDVYWNCFLKTLRWIEKHQADWENGDWFSVVTEEGKPSGSKAGPWKSPYHNGRAMIECLERLQSLPER